MLLALVSSYVKLVHSHFRVMEVYFVVLFMYPIHSGMEYL